MVSFISTDEFYCSYSKSCNILTHKKMFINFKNIKLQTRFLIFHLQKCTRPLLFENPSRHSIYLKRALEHSLRRQFYLLHVAPSMFHHIFQKSWLGLEFQCKISVEETIGGPMDEVETQTQMLK